MKDNVMNLVELQTSNRTSNLMMNTTKISRLKTSISRLFNNLLGVSNSKLKDLLRRTHNVSFVVYFLFILFGLVSWTAANGVLSESPVLTAILPECERLTSYIVIIVQCANIGPLAYLIIRGVVKLTCKKSHILDISAIYTILFLALITSILLIFLWSYSTTINGVHVSTAFFVLTGFLSISDCTSTVLFLPFVALYPDPYISALYIGEGLSGVIPSIWALIQGSPTSNCHENKAEPTGIRFSPNYYFIIIPLITTFSLVAFTLILILPVAKRERHKMENNNSSISNNQEISEETENNATSSDSLPFISNNNAKLKYRIQYLVQYVLIEGVLCFFANSFLSSIAPFFTIPYGTSTFLWALNMTLIAGPIGSLLGGVFNPRSTRSLWSLLASFLLISTWLTFLAIWEGTLPLGGSIIGTLHIVLLQALTGLVAGYVKVGVGIQAKNEGGTAFMLCIAAATQVGSLLGGLTAFIIVNYTNILH